MGFFDGGFGGLLGGLVGLGGSLISSTGASNQASATLQAAKDQQKFLGNAFGDAQMNQLALFLGPEKALQLGKGILGQQGFDDYWGVDASNPTFSDQNRTRIAELDQIIANGGRVAVTGPNALPWSNANKTQNTAAAAAERLRSAQAERDALFTAAGGNVGKTGRADRAGVQGMGEGIIPQYQRYGQQAVDAASGDLARIRSQNAGLLADIDLWGKGQEDMIRRDTSRSIENNNASATAEAIASGLGNSSVASYQRSANRRRGLEGQTDALNQLYNQQVDRRVAGRQYADSRDIAASEGVRNLAYNVNTQPLDMQANLFSSSTFTPWNNRNTDSLFPDASPSAAFGTNFGNALAAGGMTALGASLGNRSSTPAAATSNVVTPPQMNQAQYQQFLQQFDPRTRSLFGGV